MTIEKHNELTSKSPKECINHSQKLVLKQADVKSGNCIKDIETLARIQKA